jgi:hypothetical protein
MKNITLVGQEWKQRVESLIAADTEDAAAAQALYDQHKIEGADLIAADITLPEGTGIINCRLNGEHKQIRF